MKKINNTLIIDTAGQWTVIIPDKSASQQLELSKSLMNQLPLLGQVAYLNLERRSIPQIKFMGGEFSINGSLAAAQYLTSKIQTNQVEFLVNNILITGGSISNSVYLKTPNSLILEKSKNAIRFDGIKYQIINSVPNFLSPPLSELENNSPATGIIYYQQNRIWPLVYVKNTNTCIWETACGSASLALFLLRDIDSVIQPSNQVITIKKLSNSYQISADYKLISQGVLK